MSKSPSKPRSSSNHNVVPMPMNRETLGDMPRAPANAATLAMAGSPADPRMQEARRLMESFLAIEDQAGRAALITLAESLVSYDWVRKAQRR